MIVAGVDSHATAEVHPSITAIELHPERHAALATTALTARLRGETIQAPQVVRGDLIARESTAR
jgi:DNA-binding LacI/PurR family transcriptional regulator